MRPPLGPAAARMASNTSALPIQNVSLVNFVSEQALTYMRQVDDIKQEHTAQAERLQTLEKQVEQLQGLTAKQTERLDRHAGRLDSQATCLKAVGRAAARTQTTVNNFFAAVGRAQQTIDTEDEDDLSGLDLNALERMAQSANTANTTNATNATHTAGNTAPGRDDGTLSTGFSLHDIILHDKNIFEMSKAELGKWKQYFAKGNWPGVSSIRRWKISPLTGEAAVNIADQKQNYPRRFYVFAAPNITGERKKRCKRPALAPFRIVTTNLASAARYRDEVLRLLGGKIKPLPGGQYTVEFGVG